MPRASLERLQKNRADKAREKMRKEAETPSDDTAKALVQAGQEYRKFDAAAREPDERTIDDLLTKYPELFRAFLASKGVEMHKKKVPDEEQMRKLPEVRIEFLERVEYAEYVQTLVTPELIGKIIDHGFADGDLSFKKIVDLSRPEAVVAIVKDALLPMACKEPKRFDKLAASIETATAHKRTVHYQEAEKKAHHALDKYKLAGNFDRLVDASRSGMPQAEYVKMLREQVIQSKGLMAGWQKGIDAKYENRVKEIEKLNEKLNEAAEKSDAQERETARLERVVRALEREARFERERAQEPEHPVFDELVEAKADLKTSRQEFQRISNARIKLGKRVTALVEANETLKKKTSHTQAEDLKLQVVQIDTLMAKVKRYEVAIGETLKAALIESPLLREGVHPSFFNEHPAITEAPEAPKDASEARERIFAKALPSQEALQGDFDRFVLQERYDGFSGSREELMDRFVESEAERVESECKTKAADAGGEGWLARLMASVFARKKRGEIRSDLKEKRKNLH